MQRSLALAFLILAVGMYLPAQVPVSTGEWEPFTGADLPNHGVAAELFAAICRAGGVDFRFEFVPWVRAENDVLEGDSFGAFPYAVSEERKSKFDFSEVFFYTVLKVFHYGKTDRFAGQRFGSLSELSKYSFIILAGSWFEKDLRAAGLKVETAVTLDQAIKMLQSGRADLLVEDQTVAYDAFKRGFPAELGNFRPLANDFFGRGTAALMVSRSYPNSKAILAKINAGYRTIKENGILEGFAKKYNLVVK